MLINIIQNVDGWGLVLCLVNFSGITFSVAYVMYPKSSLARSIFTKIALVLYALATAFFVFGVIIIISIVGLIQNEDDPDNDFKGIWRFFYVYLLLTALIPILHCILLIIIWRQRKSISWIIQDIERRKLFNANNPAPSMANPTVGSGVLQQQNFGNQQQYQNYYAQQPMNPNYANQVPHQPVHQTQDYMPLRDN